MILKGRVTSSSSSCRSNRKITIRKQNSRGKFVAIARGFTGSKGAWQIVLTGRKAKGTYQVIASSRYVETNLFVILCERGSRIR
jgi:hypothetical protein